MSLLWTGSFQKTSQCDGFFKIIYFFFNKSQIHIGHTWKNSQKGLLPQINGKMYTWLSFPSKMKTGVSRSWSLGSKVPSGEDIWGEERQSCFLRQEEAECKSQLSREWDAESEHPYGKFRMGVGLPGKVSQHVSHDTDPPSSSPGLEETGQEPSAESCSYSFLYLSH